MSDTPLLYTSKGNVPFDTVTLHHEWDFPPGFIKYREFYTDNASGEVIKDSTAIYGIPGGQSIAAATSC